VEANDGGTIRRFVYSGWNLQFAYDAASTVRAAYVTAPGPQPGAVYEIVQGGTPYYPLVDGLGSVTALTDGSGAVVGHERYSAFGVPAPSGVVDNGFTFTGHQYDSATGLVYARERYYDPTIGRFISQDPDPAVNPYAYAFDSPTDLTDPLGRATLIERIKLLLFGPAQSAGYIASQAARDERARQAALLAAQKAAELQITVVNATRVFINDTWKPGGGM
jgi:RHS repeat-associated protein